MLLHLKLPNISGLDVLRRIRDDERTRRLPVVIPTSSNKAQDPISGYDLVANSYVRKPVDVTALADAARQLGMYWLLLNEAPPIRSH